MLKDIYSYILILIIGGTLALNILIYNYYIYGLNDTISQLNSIKTDFVSIYQKPNNGNIIKIISNKIKNDRKYKVECYFSFKDFYNKRYLEPKNYNNYKYVVFINSSCSKDGDNKTIDFLNEDYNSIFSYFNYNTPIYGIGYVRSFPILIRLY